MRPETRVGCDYAHAIVDDHSRLAYVELHDDEKAATVTGFLERALSYFADHGITVKRLMTDNGFSHVKNRSLRELLAREGPACPEAVTRGSCSGRSRLSVAVAGQGSAAPSA
jgi:hypothetical protein